MWNAVGAGKFKHWDTHLAKVTWLVSTMGSANQNSSVQQKGIKICWGTESMLFLPQAKANPFVELLLLKDLDTFGKVWCVPQGDLILGEKSR